MPDRQPLAVWLYGTRVGTLSISGEDHLELRWTGDALDRWGLNSRVVSNLLPLSPPNAVPHRARVKAFVDGLLPEGHARTNYAFEAGLRPDDSFGLLAVYGRDTAGALVFQPEDEPEPIRVGTYLDMDEDEIARRLREADRHTPTRTDGRLRDSSTLAGMQPKITAHRAEDGRWQACLDGAPSTWIIKLAQPQDTPAADVVDTEVLSLDLARAVGLPAAQAEIATFNGIRTITVRRFDRTVGTVGTVGTVDRVHQEDLAQAIGLNTADPLRKFQRGNTMPSLAQAAHVLRDGGTETDDLLRLATLNYLLGNIDAHAKNISFLRFEDGTVALSPAYDIAMHLHHSGEGHRSALYINHKVLYADMTGHDLVIEGSSWGMPARRARTRVLETAGAVRDAVDDLDRTRYPGVSRLAIDLVRGRAERTIGEVLTSLPHTATGRPTTRRGPRRRRPPGQNGE